MENPTCSPLKTYIFRRKLQGGAFRQSCLELPEHLPSAIPGSDPGRPGIPATTWGLGFQARGHGDDDTDDEMMEMVMVMVMMTMMMIAMSAMGRWPRWSWSQQWLV